MALTKETLLEAIKNVMDPELGKTLMELGMITKAEVKSETECEVEITLTTPACPLKDKIGGDVKKAVEAAFGPDVKCLITFGAKPLRQEEKEELLKGVKNVLLVASGKGGVGKSTVASNLAFALKSLGLRVGLLDADIYGPSIPLMVGIKEPKFMEIDNKPAPPFIADMPVLSIGYFIKPDQPVIWRGPMLHSTLKQFLSDFEWGELDYIVVDMPPGTGDVQISLAQLLEGSQSIMVTTPQKIAVADVLRAKMMFERLNIPVLGYVENMAAFVCPHCGAETKIFKSEEGDKWAAALELENLGSLPIDPTVTNSGEAGMPIVLKDPDCAVSKKFVEIAEKIKTIIDHNETHAHGGGCGGCHCGG